VAFPIAIGNLHDLALVGVGDRPDAIELSLDERNGREKRSLKEIKWPKAKQSLGLRRMPATPKLGLPSTHTETRRQPASGQRDRTVASTRD
jgi:hypothetical protein